MGKNPSCLCSVWFNKSKGFVTFGFFAIISITGFRSGSILMFAMSSSVLVLDRFASPH